MKDMSIIMKDKTSICRVCVNEIEISDKCFYLFENIQKTVDFETVFEDMLISEKVMAIANVDINESDGLPNLICSNCLLELEDAYIFKRKCENSDEMLRIATNKYESTSSKIREVACKEEIDSESHDGYSDDENETIALSELQQPEDVKTHCDITLNENILPENVLIKEEDASLSDSEQQTNNKTTERKSRAIDLKLECHDCGNYFKSKCKLQVHWKKEHSSFTCSHCKRVFKSCKSFLNHQKNPPILCRKVNFSKIRVEDKGKKKRYFCQECDFSTKCSHTIINHLVVHSNDLPYSCDLCTKAYSRPQTLKAHKERAHKTYYGQRTCTVCGDILGKSQYWQHMKKHSTRQLPCKICKKMMKPSSIANHMKRHSGVKAFACEKCPSTFYTYPELYYHLKNKHEKKKEYFCKMCGYKLHNRYIMAKHEKKHKEDNIGCSICGKFMENGTQMALHKQRHVKRDHKCDYCDNNYYSRKSLLKHVRKNHNMYCVLKN